MSPAVRAQCLALVERVLAAQGDHAEPELVALQHTLTAPDPAEEIALCLELCRSALEHHEEVAAAHGKREMHRHLYEVNDYAINTLARYRTTHPAPTVPAYWSRVHELFEAYRAEVARRA